MSVRAVRGAITVETNSAEEIWSATEELVREIVARNDLKVDDIASVLFTTTEDLNAAFPAKGARNLEGWDDVPLTCAQEIPVPGSLPRCIRVMMHINTEKGNKDIHHVFLREAVKLRPDLANR
ncbi:chorismate mutase [Brevibacillus fluminis]|uniref:chorismate mutase n=1 Tax=Brevibacillus fluminis TaxID=511487 RepID=A0A3M8D0M8_9BACL|nr:chorismate mutase [Brevibacillus fluminis]RNB81636.1 chorismate mutase [Brevibacillus fluminis]